jgi:hypothetical protein
MAQQRQPEIAAEFCDLYGGLENALRNTGFCKARERAEADWVAFAKSLGEEFFTEVLASGKAATLMAGRPRMQVADGLGWKPEQAELVTNVHELFINGVCQVRHHVVHRQKFRGSEEDRQRDVALVTESLWVLQYVLEKHPKMQEHL